MMGKIEFKKYGPTVTIREMLAFRPEFPTTWTASKFVNAVLEIFCRFENEEKVIANLMELDYRDFVGAFHVETGMKFSQFHDYWRAQRVNIALVAHPDAVGDELAFLAGFESRGAFWTFCHSKRYKKIAEEMGYHIFPKPQKQVHHFG